MIAKLSRNAFSLVEILVVIALLGVVATVAVPLVTGVPDAAKKRKLEQDVVIVNNAIDSYLASGGAPENLGSVTVIGALKQRVLGGMPAEMMGPQGPFLDPTVITNPTDFGWSAFFTTDPRPRFYIAQSREGVVFGKGPAMAVGGVAERPDEARPQWLWTYGEATAPGEKESFVPLAVDTGSAWTNTPLVAVTLGPPKFTPGNLTTNIWGFPLSVTITNTNPTGSSRVYYKVGNGNYTLFDNTPFNVDPGASLTAVCVSLDPSRYYNSAAANALYSVIPLELAVTVNSPTSVTYAQAGGIFTGINQLSPVEATITLEDGVNKLPNGLPDNLVSRETGADKYIPAVYLKNANFVVRYTTDGSDPATNSAAQSGPSFNGYFSPVKVSLGLSAWGTNSSIMIRAIAFSINTNWFATSPEPSPATSVIALTELPVEIYPRNPVGMPQWIQIMNVGAVPAGIRTYYTTDGFSPLTAEQAGVWTNNSRLTDGQRFSNTVSGAFVLKAQATGPAGTEQWFSSALASSSYRLRSSVSNVVLGANIGAGDINGSFRGSVFVSAPADLGIFNAGGQILGGSLYLPGLPGIDITGDKKTDDKTVAVAGQPYSGAGEGTSQIGGKEFTADGQLAVPQLDTRKIVDLDGPTSPTNYTVKITKSAYIEGKIYRRSGERPLLSVPAAPTNSLSVYTNSVITGSPATNLPAGIYSNKVQMAVSGVLNLGASGVTTDYVFAGSSTSFKGTVNVLGPVRIFLLSSTGDFVVDGTFGNATNAPSLQVIMQTNNTSAITIKSGALYAQILAPGSAMTVKNNTAFVGSLYTKSLTVEPNATVNVE